MTTGEREHLLDLRQIEFIQQLATQLHAGLGAYQQLQQSVALLEGQANNIRAGVALDGPADLDETHARQEEARANSVRLLSVMKAEVFNASNTLKQLHEARKRILSEDSDNGTGSDSAE